MNRRMFGTVVAFPSLLSIGCSAGSVDMLPVGPSPSPTPAPGPSPQPIYQQQACWGTMIGSVRTVTEYGNLLEIIRAAKIDYKVSTSGSTSGMVLSFDGVTPPTGIIFLVNGKYFNTDPTLVFLSPKDTFAAYAYSGHTWLKKDENTGSDVCA